MASHWQTRFVDRLRLLDGSLECEVGLPEHTVRIDGLYRNLQLPAPFGPLNEGLAGRTVGIEHFRARPRRESVVACRLKALALVGVARRERPEADRASRARRPALVVVCIGGLGAWVRGPLRAHPYLAGVHDVPDPYVDIVVFDVRALADDGTWGALRAAAEPPRRPIRELIAELLGDRTLSTVLRATYAEEIMNRAADTNTRRDPTTFERLLRTVERLDAEYDRARAEALAEGRVEGRRQGREEGRVEGREEGRTAGRREGRRDAELAVLASLGPALPPSVVDRLRAVAGTDAFAVALAEAVSADRG